MKAALFALTFAATPALAVEVPSGQPVELYEVLVDQVEGETWLRFRFVAPQINRKDAQLDFEARERDMNQLCNLLALPYAAENALKGDVIVISLSDRITEFGVADPDATQFFEAYRPVDNLCIWEGF